MAVASTTGLPVLWHVTLVLTAGLGVGDGAGVTLVVFGALCAATIAECVW
jgi:hypothetical protein